MEYIYYDLGYITAETVVEVTLSSAANVHLLDYSNYYKYKNGSSFRGFGGYIRYSPCSFTVPRAGRWFVTIDLGGYSGTVGSSVSTYKTELEPYNERLKWQVQSDDDDYTVKVSSRYLEKNPQYGPSTEERTDFLIFDKATGKHKHLTINEGKKEFLKSWHKWKK